MRLFFSGIRKYPWSMKLALRMTLTFAATLAAILLLSLTFVFTQFAG